MSSINDGAGFSPKKENEVKEEYRKKSAFYRLCYTEDGEFSVTRITMVVTFISSLLLLWGGAMLHIFWAIQLPQAVYNYAVALTGGSILQYGGTKIKNTILKKNGH